MFLIKILPEFRPHGTYDIAPLGAKHWYKVRTQEDQVPLGTRQTTVPNSYGGDTNHVLCKFAKLWIV